MVDRIYRNANPLPRDGVRVSYLNWVKDLKGNILHVRYDVMKDGNQSVYFAETLGM